MAQVTALQLGGIGAPCCCGSTPVVTCSPCDIPQTDLTVSWVNVFTGNGSEPLVYLGGSLWETANCVDNGSLFLFACTGGSVELRVIFFTLGVCPSGTQQYCSNQRVAPLSLTLSAHTCTPFSFTFTVNGTNCPNQFSQGDQSYTVTV